MFITQETTEEVTTTNSATRIGARRNHLNFALPDISSSINGRIRLFYVSWRGSARWGRIDQLLL